MNDPVDKNKEKYKNKKDDSDKTSSIVKGVAVWVWWGIGFEATTRKIENVAKAKNVSPDVQCKKMTEFLETNADVLEAQAENNTLNYTEKMRKNMKKSANGLRDLSKNMDKESTIALNERIKLKDKLSIDMLSKLWVNKNVSNVLNDILKNDALTKNIANAKSADEIKALLKDAKIMDEMPEDVLKFLAKADGVDELWWMIKILSHTKPLRFLKVAKAFRVVGFLDIAFLGIDVFIFSESMKDVEIERKVSEIRAKNKSNQAYFHLATAIGSLIIEMGILGMIAYSSATWWSLWWPWWLAIGLALGIICRGVDTAADALYFDVRNFYLQTKDHYIRQQRTAIKQAVLQVTHNMTYGNTSLNERFVEYRWWDIPDGDKIKNLKGAWETLIYLEEYDELNEDGSMKYPLLFAYKYSWKPEVDYKEELDAEQKKEYETQKAAMQKVIDARMVYIEKSYTKKKLFDGLKWAHGMYYTAKVLAESKAYLIMKEAGVRDDRTHDFDKNKEEYRKNFIDTTENKWKYAKIEAIYNADKEKFRELYKGAIMYEGIIKNGSEIDEEEKVVLGNIELVKKYYEYASMGVPEELSIDIGEFDFAFMDYNYLKTALLNLDTTINTTENLNSQQVKGFFIYNQYRKDVEDTIEISDSISQNVIYRIAKEIHGYEGKNDKQELIRYFTPANADSNGMYFDEKRYINDDRAIDQWVDITTLDAIEGLTDDNLDAKVDDIIKEWFYVYEVKTYSWGTGWGGQATWEYVRKDFIDTPTENMDEELIQEMDDQVRKILKEELSYKTKGKKKEVEEEIVEFIKTKSTEVYSSITWDENNNPIWSGTKEQWYIQLPIHLLVAAKKTGIGDLQAYLFKYDWDTIVACTLKSQISNAVDFSETGTSIQKEYLSGYTEEYGGNVDLYIADVEVVRNKFEDLLTYKKWIWAGLQIPQEYLKIYREKIQERDEFKKSLLLLQNSAADIEFKEKYKEYREYFENRYIAILKMMTEGYYRLNTNDYMIRVEALAGQMSGVRIGSDWAIEGIDDILSELQKEIFLDLIASEKIDGKTITELAKSTDNGDQKKAIRAVKQIIKSILEWQSLGYYKDGEEYVIYTGDQKFELYGAKEVVDSEPIAGNSDIPMSSWSGEVIKEAETEKEAYMRFAKERIAVNLDLQKYVSEEDQPIALKKKIDVNKVTIERISVKETETTTKANKVQETIENTPADGVYMGRKNIIYNPETNKLESYSRETLIDPDTLKIPWLDMKFWSITELIFFANRINRFTGNYLVEHPNRVGKFEFGGRTGKLYADVWAIAGQGWWLRGTWLSYDPTVLSVDAIKAHYPALLDETNQETFLEYINNLSSNGGWTTGVVPAAPSTGKKAVSLNIASSLSKKMREVIDKRLKGDWTTTTDAKTTKK